MKKQPWSTYLFWILLAEGVGILSAWLSRDGTMIFQETVIQPPLSPPALVFPIVWTILYALMGIGAARIALEKPSPEKTRALTLFLVQLLVNFLWSPIFFQLEAYGLAFLWLALLWILVFRMIRSFRALDPLAAKLQIPYLIWLTIATYLNLGVWLLN